jgi:serine/threonine-protein kinase
MHLPGGLSKPVAIKVLHESLDPGTHAAERLVSEARILARLSDPGIVAVQELTELDGRQALVMEYVPGRDLRDALACDPPIPPRATLEVVAKVAATLHNAWTRPDEDGRPLRLVHRDIKPENIRITEAGDVKLLDFGIAKPASARTWSSEQEALGTLLYMAPELFRGGEGAKQQSPARDVFGLGCALFEAVTGRALFERLDVSDVMRLGMDRASYERHLDARLDGLSGDLAALLRVMLAWDPKLRPEPLRVADVAHALVDDRRVDGLRLYAWCRGQDWTEPAGREGELSGRSVEPGDRVTLARQPSGLVASGAPEPAEPPPGSAEPREDRPEAAESTAVTVEVGSPPSRPEADPRRARLHAAGGALALLALGLVLAALALAPGPEAPAPSSASAALAVDPPPTPAPGTPPTPVAAVPPPGPPPSAPEVAPPAPPTAAPAAAEPAAAAPPPARVAPKPQPRPASPASSPSAPTPAAPPPKAAAAPPPPPAPMGTATVRLASTKPCFAVEAEGGGKRVVVTKGGVTMPATTVDVLARFDGGGWSKQISRKLEPGSKLVVECSCTSRMCEVVPR